MKRLHDTERFKHALANAVIGIDTLWGGDVLNPSGTGRFIADSWFSDDPLPRAYTDPSAARVRQTNGVSASSPDHDAIDTYLRAVDVRGAIESVGEAGRRIRGLRGAYLDGLALCLQVMWDLAMEILGKGDPVPYAKCYRASTGRAPAPSDPAASRALAAELLAREGYSASGDDTLLAAVDAWRRERKVPALYGCRGLVDIVSIEHELSGGNRV